MTVDKLNLSKWHLADVTTSSKGQKTCQLTNEHKPIAFHLGSRLRTRFGASSFDKNMESNRKNLDFDITNDKQICTMLKQICFVIMKSIVGKKEVRDHDNPVDKALVNLDT